MKRKVIATVTGLTLLMSTLVGCSGGETAKETSESQESENGKVESLEVYTWEDDATVLKPIAEKYEEETGIKININSYPQGDYKDKMLLLLNAGEHVDVMDIGDISSLTPYIEKKMLEPLDSYIEKNNVDMSVYGEGFDNYKIEDQYYSLPLRRVEWMLFANTDILEEMGVEIPENMTWDQYAEIAKELTVGEGDSKQFGGQWMPWSKHMMLVQSGKDLLADDLTELQQNFEWLNKVMNEDNSFMDVSEMQAGSKDYISWFASGKTATMVNGEWCLQLIKDRLKEEGITDFHYDCYPMPINEGVEPMTTGGNYSTWGIPSASEKKDAAFDFLRYVCGKEAGEIVATMGKIPGYNDEEIEKTFIDNAGIPSASIMLDFKINNLMPTNMKAGEINQAMNEESELYLVGAQSIEDTMNNFVTRREEILND